MEPFEKKRGKKMKDFLKNHPVLGIVIQVLLLQVGLLGTMVGLILAGLGLGLVLPQSLNIVEAAAAGTITLTCLTFVKVLILNSIVKSAIGQVIVVLSITVVAFAVWLVILF